MKQALFVVSGVAIGLLAALVAVASTRTEFMSRAEAQAAGPADSQSGGNMIMGIGGASPNQNDLCWVLIKDKGKNRQGEYDRYSLTLYKANGQGAFDLSDQREITYDAKLVQMHHNTHNKELTPPAIKKKLDQEHEREQNQQAPGGNRGGANGSGGNN